MKEYILNESKVRTTNGFRINNIKLNLSIPENLNFQKFSITNKEKVKIEESIINKELTSRIGLTFHKYYNIDINTNKKYNEPLILEYNFKNESLIDNYNITFEEDSYSDITIIYKGESNNNNFHLLKLNILGNNNSKGNITIINLLNKESSNFTEITTNILENSHITINIIDLGSKYVINNIYNKLLEKESNSEINSIYIGEKDNIIDLNYYVENIGEKSINKINVEGCLKDNAIKHFKGTIDFVKGCKKSIGEEYENSILLSKNAISRALPILLCHEEDVIGSHGESTGKIDKNKLFYLMSKGFSKSDAERLIILGNFNKNISKIPSDNIKEMIEEEIKNRI